MRYEDFEKIYEDVKDVEIPPNRSNGFVKWLGRTFVILWAWNRLPKLF